MFSMMSGPRLYNAEFQVSSQLLVRDSHGKLLVEEELEVGLCRLSVSVEDLVTVRLFSFRYPDTTSEYWKS
jgi:hypothetical protein